MGLFDFFKCNGKEEKPAETAANKQLLEKVEVEPGILLPRAFAQQWETIKKAKLPFVAIEATPAEDLTLEQSKFGHYPYMPESAEYPTDIAGRYMYPLAQINFREIPPIEGYPTSGYLQLYISAYDDLYGLDFEDRQSQKNFRVCFFEESEVSPYKTDFSFLDDIMEANEGPVSKPFSLSFTPKEEYFGIGDIRLEKFFGRDTLVRQYPEIEEELSEAYFDLTTSNGHKIGGYAYFTQYDPRDDDRFKDYILLLQIDSDDNIMWGDVGVANFFIHPNDLANRDFTRVFYSWDCH